MADDWRNAEIVQNDWQTAPVVNQPPQEPTDWKTRAADVWNRLKGNSTWANLKGVGEAALTVGTGALAAPASGVSGIGAGAAQAMANQTDPEYYRQSGQGYQDFLEGRPDFSQIPQRPIADAAAEAVQTTQQALTNEPEGEAGKAILEGVAIPFEEYEKFAYDLAYGAGEPTQVPGATGAYTALMMLPAVIGMRRVKTRGETKAPTSEALREQARKLYDEADNSGAAVKAESFSGVVDSIKRRLYDEGYTPSLHPKTAAALKELESKVGNNQTIKGTEINRRVINAARAATEPDDARIAGLMIDVYDDWMRSLGSGDMIAGSADAAKLYPQARDLWRRKMKSDEIEWAIERANNRASANYAGAAFETAVRQEFKAILNNKRRRRMFNDDELSVIRAVVDGTNTQNLLRLVGKLAPRGVISAAPGGMLMNVDPMLGAGVWAVGEGAKRAATAMTAKGAQKTAEFMRRSPPSR